MIYGYVRVSTDKQTVENQRFEIERFCEKQNLSVDVWFEETVSGATEPEKRKLGKALRQMKKGDVLVCSEISRLGRSLLMIMSVLNECMKKEVQVWTIKDNYRLGSDVSSKVLAFAFGLSAEIERNLISQRTKEALARKRAEGVRLGRPKGRKSSHVKLTGKDDVIRGCLKAGFSKSAIARKLHVHRITLSKYIQNNMSEIDSLPCNQFCSME